MVLLPKKVADEFKGKKYEVLVGIPSYNNSKTIGHVVKIVDEGIKEYFDGKGLIVNSDGNSSDDTRETFMNVKTLSEKVSFVYKGLPGKGSAMGSIMELANILEIPVVVFVDSDLRSIEPWWIDRLTRPIIDKNAVYVTPYYVRHKYDGTITNNICYPIVSAIFGKKIRQPIGGDFGVSLTLIKNYLSQSEEVWKTDVARFGIDIWMTTTAIGEKVGDIYQASLGAKIHDVKDPGKHLGPMFSQVVGTLFRQLERYEKYWMKNDAIDPVPVFGDVPEVKIEPLTVDIENLKNSARKGLEDNYGFLCEIFEKESMSVVSQTMETGEIELGRWIEIVYKFAARYRKPQLREKIIKSLVPFYFARVADFVEKTLNESDEYAENLIEEQIETFWDKKDLLVKFWKE